VSITAAILAFLNAHFWALWWLVVILPVAKLLGMWLMARSAVRSVR